MIAKKYKWAGCPIHITARITNTNAHTVTFAAYYRIAICDWKQMLYHGSTSDQEMLSFWTDVPGKNGQEITK
jgi:hypothetical protein